MKTFDEWASENHITQVKLMRDFGKMIWDAAIAESKAEQAEAPSEREAMRWEQVAHMVKRGVAPDILVDWINHPERLDYAAELRAKYG